MRSGISSFERKGWFSGALLKKDLTRFWPLWAVYAAALFFSLPMPLINMNTRGYTGAGLSPAGLVWEVSERVFSAVQTAPFFGACFGLLLAMALFSYLMNHRACQMIHALPVRREGIFLTHYTAAAGFFLIPQGLCGLLSWGVQAAMGVYDAEPLLCWVAVSFTTGMLFFSFAAVCAMFTGHLLALPAFYVILNGLAFGMKALADNALRMLLVGYRTSTRSETVIRWCTPLWHLSSRINLASNEGLLIAVCYSIVLGAVFTSIALGVYRLRRMERAGDVVTVGWVRPVFRYGVGVCFGMLLGTILYESFFENLGPWAFIGLTSALAAVGSFIAQMLLKKTLRIFEDSWKGAAALAAVMAVLLTGVKLDLVGYQQWTPRPDQVERVTLRRVYTKPSDSGALTYYSRGYSSGDPGLVEEITAIHAAMVANLPALESTGAPEITTEMLLGEGGQWRTIPVGLTYTLKDGRTVTREYSSVLITEEALKDPDSYASRLQAVLNDPRVMEGFYDPWGEDAGPVTASAGVVTAGDRTVPLEADQAARLWEAVLEDIRAGRMHRWLLADEEYSAACMDCFLDLQLNDLGQMVGGEGSLEWETAVEHINIQLQKTATSTRAMLREMGLAE